MSQLFLRDFWLGQRDGYMEQARKNMAVLLDKNGTWKLERNDPVVLKANLFWVNRAKRCHAIGLGRIPITDKFSYVSNCGEFHGSVFVNQEQRR